MKQITALGGSAEAVQHVEWLYQRAEEYYRQFPCVASVRVAGAEPELGRIAAQSLLESSFNILRIFVPTAQEQFVGLAEQSPVTRAKSWAEQVSGGDFIVSHTSQQTEPHAFDDSEFFKLAKLGSIEQAAANFGATLVPTSTVN